MKKKKWSLLTKIKKNNKEVKNIIENKKILKSEFEGTPYDEVDTFVEKMLVI